MRQNGMAYIHTQKLMMVVVVLLPVLTEVHGQVCSPPGQLCTRTTDCCRGCCEQYTCVERPYSCSPDLKALRGSSSCINHFCPEGQICYLREVCPPESPCPMVPFCRSVASTNNNTPYYMDENNGVPLPSSTLVGIFSSVLTSLVVRASNLKF